MIEKVKSTPNSIGLANDGDADRFGVINENGEIIANPSYEIETYYFPRFVGKYIIEFTDTKHCVEIN